MENKIIFKNKIVIDARILTECQKKIDKTRFYKLIKMLNLSVSADSLHPELMEEHDNYFEPRTEPEKDLWISCRENSKKGMNELMKKVQGGIKSAKNKQEKKKSEKAVQQKIEPVSGINFSKRESFVYATPEELLAALKRDIVPNLGAYLYMGEEPSDEQLINYLQTRISTNWEKKGGGIIRNVGSDLACWLKNPLSSKQMAKEDKSPMSDEPLSYEEMIAQKRFDG